MHQSNHSKPGDIERCSFATTFVRSYRVYRARLGILASLRKALQFARAWQT